MLFIALIAGVVILNPYKYISQDIYLGMKSHSYLSNVSLRAQSPLIPQRTDVRYYSCMISTESAI